jgi:hypothetical protein
MVDEDGTRPKQRRKRTKRLRYFFLNGNLHKVLGSNRPQDRLVAWDFKEAKRKQYSYSEVRRSHEKAYGIVEVAELVNRHRVNVERYILDGKIRKPAQAYALNPGRKPLAYFFTEKDVLELHDYLLTVHRGRPRKDGTITPSGIPSRAELRAMMKSGSATYIKNEDGEFVQVWKENDW